MNLYMVRHGESAIPPNCFQKDYPLSELGLRQATAAAMRFKGVAVDHLVSTAYRRCLETAQAIASVAGVPIIEEPGLGAVDAGDFHDVPVSEARERFPAWFDSHPVPLTDYADVGGESADAFYKRIATAFVERIWDRYWKEDLTVVVACHEETVNAVLFHLLRSPYEGWNAFRIDHTGITHVDVRYGRPRIRVVNDILHLREAGLPTGESGTGRRAKDG